jgi:hypothetical protein
VKIHPIPLEGSNLHCYQTTIASGQAEFLNDTGVLRLSRTKVYGDKTEVAVTGANGGPVQTVSATVEIPANDPIEAARVYQKLMSGDG